MRLGCDHEIKDHDMKDVIMKLKIIDEGCDHDLKGIITC